MDDAFDPLTYIGGATINSSGRLVAFDGSGQYLDIMPQQPLQLVWSDFQS